MANGNQKYQFNLFCGQQSYIFRTDSLKEASNFAGVKKLDSKTMNQFLQDLHLRMGQYEIPLVPVSRKPKDQLMPHPSFKDQLKAKTGKKIRGIEKMTEKEAQVALFTKLRGKK